jgi:hypothetical protein
LRPKKWLKVHPTKFDRVIIKRKIVNNFGSSFVVNLSGDRGDENPQLNGLEALAGQSRPIKENP